MRARSSRLFIPVLLRIARRRALLLFDVRSERFRVRSSAVARYSLVSSDAPDRSWPVVVFRALSGVQRTEFNYMNSSQSDCPRHSAYNGARARVALSGCSLDVDYSRLKQQRPTGPPRMTGSCYETFVPSLIESAVPLIIGGVLPAFSLFFFIPSFFLSSRRPSGRAAQTRDEWNIVYG